MKDQKKINVGKRRLLHKAAGLLLSGLLSAAYVVSSLPMTAITARAASTSFEKVTDAGLSTGTIYNVDNLPQLNSNAGTKYWFAGNAFYGLARSGREFGESYSNNTWLLEDTDAMWDGTYLYSTWGSASATTDCFTVWSATDNQASSGSYYYQKILTYGERLWNAYKSQWFNSTEQAAVGTATVTTANNEYRTYEKYLAGTTTSGSTYNYWLGAATAANIGANNYSITEVKKWYETGNTDTTKYLALNTAANATTLDNTADSKIGGTGISSSSLSVKASNIYTIEGAHLYAPSYNEFTQNESVYKAIISNVYNDYKAISSTNNVVRTAGGTTTEGIGSTHVYDRTRTDLWSRSFSGLHVVNTYFNAWGVSRDGGLYSGSDLTGSGAVAPAFNLDLSKVVMARSAQAGTAVTANSSLASYNPGDLNSATDVKFVLENSGLSLTTDINGKGLNNVVPGQTYTISYSGATTAPVNNTGIGSRAITGTKLFISAAIFNSDDEIVYYGPLASVSDASGEVDITIPEDLDGDTAYKLAVFEEQISGTYNISTPGGNTITTYATDYISRMNVASFVTSGISAVVKDGEKFTEAEKYDKATFAAKVTVSDKSLGILSSNDYYFMEENAFNALSSTDEATVSASAAVNNVEVPLAINANNFTVVFIHYPGGGLVDTCKLTIPVVATGLVENNIDFDVNAWYQVTENGITWNYKLNSNGDIIGLYTEDSVISIVDSALTLNVPSKVAGRTVVGIGGGSEDTPFILPSENNWTSVSFPSTLKVINDYAFYKASPYNGNIVIPSTVTNIGVRAFGNSTISGLTINSMDGTIGSLAFAETYSLENVTIMSGSQGLVVSNIAFQGSGLKALAVSGRVDINKNAFKDSLRLADVYLNGIVNLGEAAFTGCTSITDVSMSGTVNVGEYAFDGNTSLEHLYLPSGVTLNEYAFNGCTNLIQLESDTSIPAHAFENCGAIATIILDENVSYVNYDWEGHASKNESRNIYVRNKQTAFGTYGDNGTYYSSFGSSGNVRVYILSDSSVDQGDSVEPTEGVLNLYGYTYAANNVYRSYYKGAATSVTFYRIDSIESQLKRDSVTTDYDKEKLQSGIAAFYTGSVITTLDVDKANMTVVKVYDSIYGDSYAPDDFYIIRTAEFNVMDGNGTITEANVAALEPVTATNDDLDAGTDTGTLSVTVIVFYEDENGATKYFSAPVSIRVDKYSAANYVEQTYGSYENIANELATLSKEVKDLEAQITTLQNKSDADAAQIAELSSQLKAYKDAYEELLAQLAEYVSSTTTDNSGYFGTITDSEGTHDVVYIDGTASSYTDTGETTANGDKIYTASHDVNGDGTPETIRIYVDGDGVHVVDENGVETGDVYTDTVGALQRSLTAQLQEVEETLDTCKSGLVDIINALKAAGYDIDADLTLSEQYQEIVRIINSMARSISGLESDLATANTNAENYENALASIYALLTNSTLDKDNISGINNTLNAIVNKINTLKNNLDVAQATVTDLQGQLAQAEQQKSALEAELATTKQSLEETKTALQTAKDEKADLVAAYEKAISDGDAESAAALQAQIDKYDATIAQLQSTQEALEQKEQDIKDAQDALAILQKQLEDKEAEVEALNKQIEALSNTADGLVMTVATANTLFGLELPEDASDSEIYDAIQNYVRQKLSSDETIAAIQTLVGSTNTGSDLVADVSTAISNGSGSTGTDVNSGNYKAGYDTGYTDGYAVGKTDGTNAGYTSGNKDGYDTGYAAGYAKAVSENTSTSKNDGSTSTSTDSATITKLTSQVESLTSQNTSLNSTVSSLNTKVSELEKEKSELETKNTSLTSDNTTLKDKVSSLNTKVTTLEKEKNTLQSEKNTLQSEKNSLQSSNNSLQSEKNSLQSEKNSLQNTNNSLQNEKNSLQNTNTSLQNENNSLKNENANLKSAANSKSTTTYTAQTTTPATTQTQTTATTKSSTAGTGTTANTTTTATTGSTANSANGKSSTTTTNANSSTGKTTTDKSDSSKKNGEEDEEDVEIEGSTVASNTATGSTQLDKPVSGTLQQENVKDNSKVELGDTVPMRKPSNSQGVNPAQKAKSIVIQEEELAQVTSNGKTDNAISDESLNNIMTVVDYYSNNLDALSGLGYEDIDKVVADETKAVTIDVVAAGDIKPSASQEAQMRSGTDVKAVVSYDGIDNEGMYLVIHESSKRTGMYDVVLENASSGKLEFSVADLSPVAIAKVTISNVATANGTLDTVADTMDDQGQNKGVTAKTVVLILLLIALIVGGVVLVLVKLDHDGKIKLPRIMP